MRTSMVSTSVIFIAAYSNDSTIAKLNSPDLGWSDRRKLQFVEATRSVQHSTLISPCRLIKNGTLARWHRSLTPEIEGLARLAWASSIRYTPGPFEIEHGRPLAMRNSFVSQLKWYLKLCGTSTRKSDTQTHVREEDEIQPSWQQ